MIYGAKKNGRQRQRCVDVNIRTYGVWMHRIGSSGRRLRRIGDVNKKLATVTVDWEIKQQKGGDLTVNRETKQ